MKKLPVGIQSFERIRQDDLVYVDKTKFIYDLVDGKHGYYFFLSRPRRFGKSLLISTLKELFLAHRELFAGLWIDESDYFWQKYPVIHLDFSAIASETPDVLRVNLSWALERIGKAHGIDISSAPSPEAKLEELIHELSKKTRVVVLIDEYDKPLLEHVNSIDVMREMQVILKNFYATIKATSSQIQFLFMTGVTKFSKTSVFSGMNNLVDLTLLDDMANLLGYTDEEIDHYFQPHMQEITITQDIEIDAVKHAMKHWYNGYQFSQKSEKVYNPFSVLMYLLTKELRNYWFESGTPSFLVNLIREKKYNIEDLEHTEINIRNLGSFEIDDIQLIPLLLQTGYLTIKGYDPITHNYQLGYPNEETKASFLQYFMRILTQTKTELLDNAISRLTHALKNNDLEQFFDTLKVFFASIPYTIQSPQEQYYQSIFYVIMNLVGAYTQAEVATNNGRIDCTIETDKQIYISLNLNFMTQVLPHLNKSKKKSIIKNFYTAAKK
jgi:hypothetical protein